MCAALSNTYLMLGHISNPVCGVVATMEVTRQQLPGPFTSLFVLSCTVHAHIQLTLVTIRQLVVSLVKLPLLLVREHLAAHRARELR